MSNQKQFESENSAFSQNRVRRQNKRNLANKSNQVLIGAQDSQYYGVITGKCGGSLFKAKVFNGNIITVRIPGVMRKGRGNEWVDVGKLVLLNDNNNDNKNVPEILTVYTEKQEREIRKNINFSNPNCDSMPSQLDDIEFSD